MLIIGIWKKRIRNKLLLAASITLYFFSNEFILMEFIRAWEIKPMTIKQKEKSYDLGIVLGGYAVYDAEYDLIGFHESSDRILEAVRLYNTDKIQKIYLAGGSGNLFDTLYKEANFIEEFLISCNIPSDDIIVDSKSRNTHQNAQFACEYLNTHKSFQRNLLITSATHMRRSLACFDKLGCRPLPYSVDRKAGPRKFTLAHLFLPNVSALFHWNSLIHEWVGSLSYKIVGYI